jgi:hypothetical protein
MEYQLRKGALEKKHQGKQGKEIKKYRPQNKGRKEQEEKGCVKDRLK